MGVNDGTPVDAATTNPAFLDANQDDTALGKISFNNAVDPGVSGPMITNIQREANSIASYTGKPTNAAKDALPVWADPSAGAPTNNLTQRSEALTEKFNSVSGHAHSPAAGQGAPIQAQHIANVPLKGFGVRAPDLTGVTGGSHVVTTQMTGKFPSLISTVAGVVVSTPYNFIPLRNPSTNNPYEDGSGNQVFGRLTESVGVWTLTFFVNLAGVETAYSFSGSVSVAWWYQELWNPLQPLSPVYSEMFTVPSLNAAEDVPDASVLTRGLVSLTAQEFLGEKHQQLRVKDRLRLDQQTINDGTTYDPITLSAPEIVIVDNTIAPTEVRGIDVCIAGQVIGIFNASSSVVTIKHNLAGSGFPFLLPDNDDIELPTNAGGLFVSDGASYSPIGGVGGANKYLSNLKNPTAINQDLIPNADDTLSVGSSTGPKRWANVFTKILDSLVDSLKIKSTLKTIFVDELGTEFLEVTKQSDSYAWWGNLTGVVVKNSAPNDAIFGSENSAAGSTKSVLVFSGDITGNVGGASGDIGFVSGSATDSGSTANTGSGYLYTGDAYGSGNSGNIQSGTGSAYLGGSSGYIWFNTGGSPGGGTSGQIDFGTGATTSGSSGFIRFQTGGPTTGASGYILFKTGYCSSGGTSGALFFESGGTVGAASGNLQFNTGSAPGSTSGSIDFNTGGGSATSGPLNFNTGGATGSTGPMSFLTGSGAASGGVTFETGTASAGNSGDITFRTGTASGTRGKIKIQDGSEGTVGHVWTSTGVTGEGAWAAPGGGGANTSLSNLSFPTAINQSLTPGSAALNCGGNGSGINYYWVSVRGQEFMRPDPATNYFFSLQSGGTLPSGVVLTGNAGLTAGTLRKLGVWTQNDSGADANPTGTVYVETGNKTSGSGNSGPINIQTGTSAGGLRGEISLNGRQVNVSSTKIVNVTDPTSAQDAATKAYVDSKVVPAASAISALDIDWALSETYYKSISANSTFTFSNLVDGKSITVALTNTSGGAVTVAFPSVVKRSDFPTSIPASKSNVYVFTRMNGVNYASGTDDMA